MNKSILKIIKQIVIIIIFIIVLNYSWIILNILPKVFYGMLATCCLADGYDMQEIYRHIGYLLASNFNVYISTFLLAKIFKLKKHITNLKINYVLIFICLLFANIGNLKITIGFANDVFAPEFSITLLLVIVTMIFMIFNTIWLFLKLKKLKTPKL